MVQINTTENIILYAKYRKLRFIHHEVYIIKITTVFGTLWNKWNIALGS